MEDNGDFINSSNATTKAKAGKYLTFELGEEDYGIEILKVREIIGMTDITAVPQLPDYGKGVINLRGKVIPVIDIRLKFGMEELEYTPETCIIVINLSNVLMGIIIDKVKEVIDIQQSDIEPAPNFGTSLNTEYILGMGKVDDRVKILIDIDNVLSMDVSMATSIEE